MLFRSVDFKVGLNPKQEKVKENILKQLKENSFDKIEDIKSISGKDKEVEQMIRFMIDKDIVVFGENKILLKEDFNKAKELLINHIEKNGNITVSEYRDILKSSRKNILSLLDYFDSIGLTKRVDDIRILVK